MTFNPIQCAICLNIDNTKRVEAVVTIEGYSVCAEHAQWMARPHTDFESLLRRAKNNPSEAAT